MKSSKSGKNILNSSITSITSFGLWVMCNNNEFFIPFKDYPELKEANLNSIFNVKTLSPNNLYWPDIDVDIEIDAIKNPSNYILLYKK